MKAIKEKHPLAVRWAHWINFPVLTIMIWSGLLIYWANDVYSFTIFGHTFFHFFPDPFYKLFDIPHRLSEGMAFHFLFMWFFAINGFLYVLYTAISGEWRQLLPNRHSFKEAWLVLLHDLHIRKMLPPQKKYNAAQRIAYTSIIIMGFGSLITGLSIYKPVQFYWLTWLCGGYHLARIEHFILTIGYVLFFIIHIMQVIIAGWNNFRSVVSGFEIVNHKQMHTLKSPRMKSPFSKNRFSKTQFSKETISKYPLSKNTLSKNRFSKKMFDKKEPSEMGLQKQINRRNFIAFTGFAGFGALAFGGLRWLYKSPFEKEGITAGAKKPLRRALDQNELLFRKTFSSDHLVQTYPKSMAAQNVRVNSEIGIDDDDFDPKTWSLNINKKNGSRLQLSLKDIMALPKTEIVYDFKCVEGWDQISHWGGLKFSDFITHYHLQEEAKLQYVGFATPDKAYYVGIDMPSAMHPQTLLAYEVNDRLLPVKHGKPLRLIIPVKYGIKNLKRIGTISFSDQRLPDYWAEQGYDYYSGL